MNCYGEWKKGVAFVRGINMFGNSRIKKEEMLELSEKIEDENVRVVGLYRSDNIIFEKREIHYAEVGKRLEGVLSDHFGEPIHVTTRSIGTVRGIVE